MEPESATHRLVESARAGDRSALDELFRRSRQRLVSWIQFRMGEHLRARVEAEDVLQETFVWATRSIERFRWRGEDSFYRWLRGIADHMLLKAANRGKRDLELALDEDVADSGVPPSRAMRREERLSRLETSLERLSPEHRDVIVLSRIEGLRVKEIAKRMDRSPNAVSLLLARALKKLRETFGDTESLHLPDRKLEVDGGDHGAP